MKRSFIFVICLAIFNACGGGGEKNINLEKIEIKDILIKNSWYEVCDNNKSYKFDFYNKKYIKTIYNDTNFTKKKESLTYEIMDYNDIGFETKNEICKSSNILILDENNTINTNLILFECINKANSNEINLIFAWKSKKLAKQNIEECIQ